MEKTEGQLVLGVGCRKGAPADDMRRLVEELLAHADVNAGTLTAIATLEGKADEPAIRALAQKFGLPIRVETAARLEQETPRLATPSEAVFRETGCHGVAEAAALAVCGPESVLLVAKQTGKGVTAALAGPAAVLPVTLA